MVTNRYKTRLKRIQNRFNETFGTNPLIKPETRISVIFAVIKLGLLESKISVDFNAKDIQKFTRVANMLEKIFVKIDCLNKQKSRN